MPVGRRSLCGLSVVIAFTVVFAFCTHASAQANPSDSSYYYVANTRPPDDFLALRTHPTARMGLRIMVMRNGTRVQVLQRRSDGWWYVRVIPSGEEGWALSGQGNKIWIECCVAASVDRAINSAPPQQLIRFRTPSNNVHCMAVTDEGKAEPNGIACDITNRSSTKPILPKPRDCEFDWGQRFELGNNSDAGLECASDWVGSYDSQILQYGSSTKIGNIVCSSLHSGLECRNVRGRGYFFVAKHPEDILGDKVSYRDCTSLL